MLVVRYEKVYGISYADISGVSDADVTAVSYSGTTSGSLTGEDLTYLVRDNGKGGVRIDIPGVAAGTYTLNVTTSSGDTASSGGDSMSSNSSIININTAGQAELMELPGIGFESNSKKRYYRNSTFASYIIGYAKKNEEGKLVGELGIEGYFDDVLFYFTFEII